MSCWVVPSIAAEYWRIPVDDILDKVRRNAIPIRREGGFTFVDILPDPPSNQSLPFGCRPSTFVSAPEMPAPIRQTAISEDWVSVNPAWRQTASQRRAPISIRA